MLPLPLPKPSDLVLSFRPRRFHVGVFPCSDDDTLTSLLAQGSRALRFSGSQHQPTGHQRPDRMGEVFRRIPSELERTGFRVRDSPDCEYGSKRLVSGMIAAVPQWLMCRTGFCMS